MIEMNEAEALSQEIQTAHIARVARRSAKILKITAVVLVAGSIVSGWIAATNDENFYSNTESGVSLKWRIGQFLGSALWTAAWAALVLAAGFAIEIVALRAARGPEASEPPEHKPAQPVAPVPTNFAARTAPAATAPIPVTTTAPAGPPPMKIANDEIWRR